MPKKPKSGERHGKPSAEIGIIGAAGLYRNARLEWPAEGASATPLWRAFGQRSSWANLEGRRVEFLSRTDAVIDIPSE